MTSIGIWMSGAVLAHKLELADHAKTTEATWNTKRFPKRLSTEPPPHHLFIASGGAWRGYFALLPEVLWNPEDERAPYSLIFDAGSWTEIGLIAVKRFRGITYNVPEEALTYLRKGTTAEGDQR